MTYRAPVRDLAFTLDVVGADPLSATGAFPDYDSDVRDAVLQAAGVDIDIEPGVGPVLDEPFASREDLDRIPELTADMIPDIAESVRRIVLELGPTPLIGFAGAPFTLASYLIEGGPSKNHERTKALMHADPKTWHALLGKLTDVAIAFLRAQIGAGVDAVQLFDSWAGALTERDYRSLVLPHSTRIFSDEVISSVPRTHFGVGTGELLGAMGEAGPEVVGVDYRVDLADALVTLRRELGIATLLLA